LLNLNLLQSLADSGEACEINRMLSHLTLDIIGQSAFGTKLRGAFILFSRCLFQILQTSFKLNVLCFTAQEDGEMQPLLKQFDLILRRNDNVGSAGFGSLLAMLIPPVLFPQNW